MKGSQRKTITEWIAELDPESLENVQALLNRGASHSLTESDVGCYDAIIQFDDEKPIFVEVNLDTNNRVEDLYCTCNIGSCVHLAAVLHEINAGHVSPPCENKD